jgi:hypothetical protein
MAAKTKFQCLKCGDRLAEVPEVVPERAEDGTERLFRSIPTLCPTCRSKKFWGRVSASRRKEGKQEV